MSSVGSVTRLIGLLRKGDSAAAQELWDRFAVRLLVLARVSLPNKPLPVADEEDVVQSALGSFFAGLEKGKYTPIWLIGKASGGCLL